MSRVLVKGGTVLTMAGANHATADVLVEDGWISEIGTDLRSRGADVIDATDRIVMPGFVDAHRHAWRTVLKHRGASTPDGLMDRFGPDEIYASTLLGLVSAAAAGTTTVLDWCDAAVSEEIFEAALQAHVDAGIRTVFAPGSHLPNPSWQSAVDRLAGAPDALHTIAAGPPDPGTDRSATAEAIAHARGLRLRSHVHVGGGRDDAGTVAAMGRDGLLGPDVTLVHCTRLSAADLDAAAEAGSPVVLTPSTEMARGFGLPPVQEFLDRGIRPGLGVDDEGLAPGDVFAQMRSVISLQHAMYFDLKLVGKAGLPNLMTTREAIRSATIDGARAAGVGDRCGSLETGKRADILVLATDRPNIHPINDPIGAVVWGMDTSNVETVLVAGTPVVSGGEPVADVARIRDLAAAAAGTVLAGVGAP